MKEELKGLRESLAETEEELLVTRRKMEAGAKRINELVPIGTTRRMEILGIPEDLPASQALAPNPPSREP